MYEMNDILESFTPSVPNSEQTPKDQIVAIQEEIREELRKAEKKLKKAKRKGKNGKKFKHKIKKLKKENKKLQSLLYNTKQASTKGRWDGAIEKSVPELIKLATVIVDRKFPYKGQ
ncbi:hypothetical protein [Anaerospora hongkongensis]|uniref:hypothetical protein n=1 Tax=Anaerospora hongkongensis TaxID=244830 RepID=UPI002FD9B285